MKTCRGLSGYSRLYVEEIYRAIFKQGLERNYDQGMISSLDFFKEVAKLIGSDKSLSFTDFSRIWGDICSPNLGIEGVLEMLESAEIKMHLLSIPTDSIGTIYHNFRPSKDISKPLIN